MYPPNQQLPSTKQAESLPKQKQERSACPITQMQAESLPHQKQVRSACSSETHPPQRTLGRSLPDHKQAESLPDQKQVRSASPLLILKIGGNIIASPKKLSQLLVTFTKINTPKILVHGGGKKASELLTQLGIQPLMTNGRRITDTSTLEVVTMVYAGLINKNIVAQLQAKNCNAIGLSGADLNTIQAVKRPDKPVDYGYAGDVKSVNVKMIQYLLSGNCTPVFCAITHDKKGQLLNTNADTIASALATNLADSFQVNLKYCFEKPGVLLDANDDSTVIKKITKKQFEKYTKQGIIAEGMIPKLYNGFNALASGVSHVSICNLETLSTNEGTILIE